MQKMCGPPPALVDFTNGASEEIRIDPEHQSKSTSVIFAQLKAHFENGYLIGAGRCGNSVTGLVWGLATGTSLNDYGNGIIRVCAATQERTLMSRTELRSAMRTPLSMCMATTASNSSSYRILGNFF